MKRLVKILLGICLGFILALNRNPVFANEMDDMAVEVYINEDGSAQITENRSMNLDEGTELFISFGNLQEGQEILDFEVTGYQEVADWDMDASLEDKAGNYSIYDNDGTPELVWGIGEYGDNTYELTYTISNVVRELEDGQALYFDFNTAPDLPPDNLKVRIHADQDFTQDRVNFWGFGTEGQIDLDNGDVLWQSTGDVDYAVVLMQFPSGTFQTTVSDDMTLAEQEEMAKDGSLYEGSNSKLGAYIAIGFLGLSGIGLVAVIVYSSRQSKKIKEAGHIDRASKLKKRNKDKSRSTQPDLTDPATLFFLNHHLFGSGFEDIFQAYLIKWMREDSIKIDFEKEEKFFSDQVHARIQINQEVSEADKETFQSFVDQIEADTYQGTYEDLMWSVLINTTDAKGQVDNDRMKDWGKNQADDVDIIADYLDKYSRDQLSQLGYFSQDQVKLTFSTFDVMKPNRWGEDLVDQLIQYEHYLNEEKIKDYVPQIQSEEEAYHYLFWQLLFGHAYELGTNLKDVTPDTSQEASGYSGYAPFYYYYYPTNAMRTSYASGLTSGGFRASTSVDGMGGATAGGGGAGAGGASGGGAR